MYLVVEWTVIAAPCSNGLHIIGAAVLSKINGMPIDRPISATSEIGKTSKLGLGKTSP